MLRLTTEPQLLLYTPPVLTLNKMRIFSTQYIFVFGTVIERKSKYFLTQHLLTVFGSEI